MDINFIFPVKLNKDINLGSQNVNFNLKKVHVIPNGVEVSCKLSPTGNVGLFNFKVKKREFPMKN
jgi:hypothetical protein